MSTSAPPPSPKPVGEIVLDNTPGAFAQAGDLQFHKRGPPPSQTRKNSKFLYEKLFPILKSRIDSKGESTAPANQVDDSGGFLSGYQEMRLKGHTMAVRSLDWAPDPSTWYPNTQSSTDIPTQMELASGSMDKSLMIWNVSDSGDTKKPINIFRQHSGYIERVCYQPFNPNVIASGSTDQTVKIFDKRFGKFNSFKTSFLLFAFSISLNV